MGRLHFSHVGLLSADTFPATAVVALTVNPILSHHTNPLSKHILQNKLKTTKQKKVKL